MPEITKLASRIEGQLPAELVNFMQTAGTTAASQKQNLYLVGGVVRDLLLGKDTFDLDLVVEGDAIELARQLNNIKQGKLITHPHFKTAKIKWDEWSIDVATARSETYANPGALPSVKPGSLVSDLFRRDFTINAMAISLIPGRYGELIDLYRGKDDLEHRLIRILHEKSFTDDATRIWRGIRYEQRLDFQLEEKTLKLLKRDIPMLDTISGDRIRYELECVFKEKYPEKVLRRAEKLGVLTKLHPALSGNGWLAEKYQQARQQIATASPPMGLYLALLIYQLGEEEIKQLASHLKLSKPAVKILRDTIELRSRLNLLETPNLMSSNIYQLLHGYSLQAVAANSLASNSPAVQQNIQLFLSKLRYVKPTLNGGDIQKMGVAPGPRIKEILNNLHEARLDKAAKSKADEERLVREWLR